MLEELKQIEIETQALIDELAIEIAKADQSTTDIEKFESEIADSDAEFKAFGDEIVAEIKATAERVGNTDA